ncbi:hypothetical protein AB0F72_26145 [Actinoplanes sp. NPDC023936]|uniref:hypothetical protein n=1 Tax=Actinoplanes sp. NPDC023936 TaxID=3154910 RepID=UPI0033D9FD31
MSHSRPEGSLISVGLFFDRLADAEALDSVCATLVARGAEYTGEAWVGQSDPGPFSYVSDLAVMSVDDWPAPRVDRRPYRVYLMTAELGPVAVTFGKGDVRGGRSVEVLISGDVHDVDPAYMDEEDRIDAERSWRELTRLCRDLCETLDPLYAVLGLEEPTPTPTELHSGSYWSPATDFFVSDRLRPFGTAVFDQLLAGDVTRQWHTGMFYSYFYSETPPHQARESAELKEAMQRLGAAVVANGWVARVG